MKILSGPTVPFEALEDNEDAQEMLASIGESLTWTTLTAAEDAEGQPDPARTTSRREATPEQRARSGRVQDTARWIRSELGSAEQAVLLRLLERETTRH